MPAAWQLPTAWQRPERVARAECSIAKFRRQTNGFRHTADVNREPLENGIRTGARRQSRPGGRQRRVACSAAGWFSSGVAGSREPTVEIEGGADERQVCERLGEVAEMLRLGPRSPCGRGTRR